MSMVPAGKKAPPFELTGVDSKTYSLQAALARGPLLAVFFKVSCPTCQFTFPFVERMYRQFLEAGAAGVQIWGISQDNPQNTQRFAKEWDVTFPLLIDEDPYEISQEYGLAHVPTLFLIAPDGQVEISGDGFSKADLLSIRKSLASHLSVKPAELFRAGEQVPDFKPG
ncbi:MAG: peroxiredoxin family protein [Terriglobia bacterium]